MRAGNGRIPLPSAKSIRIGSRTRRSLDLRHDAANEDVVKRAKEQTGGDGFDIVIEASGSKSGVIMMTDVCRTGGTLMALSLSALPYEFPIGKVSFRR